MMNMKARQNKFLWIGTDEEGSHIFIHNAGTFQKKYKNEKNEYGYCYPSLREIQKIYWVLAIIPVNKLKSMLGKIAGNNTLKMRRRFYRHIRSAHRRSRVKEKNLF